MSYFSHVLTTSEKLEEEPHEKVAFPLCCGIIVEQIKQKDYLDCLKNYSGEVLLVGVNYDKEKRHTCRIERAVNIRQSLQKQTRNEATEKFSPLQLPKIEQNLKKSSFFLDKEYSIVL